MDGQPATKGHGVDLEAKLSLCLHGMQQRQGIQNQHSNSNVTLLRGRIYQCRRSAALKCLYFFQASLNFNST